MPPDPSPPGHAQAHHRRVKFRDELREGVHVKDLRLPRQHLLRVRACVCVRVRVRIVVDVFQLFIVLSTPFSAINNP